MQNPIPNLIASASAIGIADCYQYHSAGKHDLGFYDFLIDNSPVKLASLVIGNTKL